MASAAEVVGLRRWRMLHRGDATLNRKREEGSPSNVFHSQDVFHSRFTTTQEDRMVSFTELQNGFYNNMLAALALPAGYPLQLFQPSSPLPAGTGDQQLWNFFNNI